MDRVTSAAIAFTEAAYDLGVEDSNWLPKLLEAGETIIDQGLGAAGIRYGRPPTDDSVDILQIHVASGPADFAERHQRAISATPPEMLREQARPNQAATMSENTKAHPEALEIYTRHVDYCQDLLGLTAVDPSGLGVAIVAPLPEVTTISGQARRRWQMLAAHVSSGHRLRHGLAGRRRTHPTGLPHEAEAVLDPKTFQVVEAQGEAKDGSALRSMRQAAVDQDRARGRLRQSDPGRALETWKALVRGRWSLVDWFDSDGRRFMLAVPNPPGVSDPRGLTERELQVASYAAFGLSNKMIAYHLGISRPRVSDLRKAAMTKLGVRTHAQLVKRLQDFRSLS